MGLCGDALTNNLAKPGMTYARAVKELRKPLSRFSLTYKAQTGLKGKRATAAANLVELFLNKTLSDKEMNTPEQAVFAACSQIGTISNLPTLTTLASKIHGAPISQPLACVYRRKYRKANGLTEDCRTLATQYNRDHIGNPPNLAQPAKQRYRIAA
jgi:hypothetical protein